MCHAGRILHSESRWCARPAATVWNVLQLGRLIRWLRRPWVFPLASWLLGPGLHHRLALS
jgi:hypothetical protein